MLKLHLNKLELSFLQRKYSSFQLCRIEYDKPCTLHDYLQPKQMEFLFLNMLHGQIPTTFNC